MQVRCITTTPHEGQRPGTSGLRKRVKVFQEENYTQNFIQATLDAMSSPNASEATLVVGGDGRYFSTEAIQLIIRIAAGNRVGKIHIFL
jgi:phosphoglucomutase